MNAKASTETGTNLIAGATGDWEVVIGLEVHAQVDIKEQLMIYMKEIYL